MFSPTLNTALIAGLEIAVNKALTLDPASVNALTALQGHVFLFSCLKPKLTIYLIAQDNGMRLCGIYPHQADTSITGTAEDFLQLVTTDNPTNALINGSIELHGDSDALIALQKIANHIDLDWESLFTDKLGDVAGHQLANGIRAASTFFKQSADNVRDQIKDYIQYESDILPASHEAQQLYNDVDKLSLRLDRLEARIKQLSNRSSLGH